MASRHRDWMEQAQRDLSHAQHAMEDGDHEWGCFAAQQAAEKALKALYQWLGADAWGHSVTELVGALPPGHRAGRAVARAARELDKHYIPPRYPNAYPAGAPYRYYDRDDAERAIAHANTVLRFCEDHLPGPEGGGASRGTGGPPAGDQAP